jgi:hypothetical protein
VSSSDHRLARIRPKLGRIDPRTDWPQGFVRLGVAACIALMIVLGLVYGVRAVERLHDDAAENAAENYDDREFGGGNSIVVDKGALYEARARIPEDGTFRVVTGAGVRDASELTETYVDQFARSFLMPRRPAADAPWIICYGCDRAQLGAGAEVVWDNGGGIALVRLPA